MTFTQRKIATNSISLNVIDEGKGPAVLLIHGFPDDHQVWRKQIPALVAQGYRVIAPDMRGCGDSDAPGGASSYHLDHLVADLVALLDALGLDRVPVIGHDWGAVIGWNLIMQHPQRVSRYAALSVGHPLAYIKAGGEQMRKGWYVMFFQLRGIAEMLLRANQWWMFRTLTYQPDEAPRWIERMGRPGRLTAGLNYYRGNLAMLGKRDFPSITVPVLGVWSDGDRFLTEKQMTGSARYAKAGWRYERVEGVSHWLQLEAPDRVNALLLDFLKKGVHP